MMVNHGRFPGEVAGLPAQEKILMTLFALKEIKSRPKPKGDG